MSEFGKGLTYCIGLFLAHAERFREYKELKHFTDPAGIWFDGASDHLYDLDIQIIKNKKLKKEINEWKSKCLHFGHGCPQPVATEEDVEWAIDKAKEYLRRIDKTMLKVKVEKGQWE